MIKKRCLFFWILVLFAIVLSLSSFASNITINQTTYFLNIYSNYDNKTVYPYTNITFFASFLINTSVNSSKNCLISFEDGVSNNTFFNATNNKYIYVRNFSLNDTFDYNVTCEINESLNITENSTVEIRYNFPPTFGNFSFAVFNVTDYQAVYFNTFCSDIYNDNISVFLFSNLTFGNITNKTYYYFLPGWDNVNLALHSVTVNCTDGVYVINQTFYINVTPRNVSVDYIYPLGSYINMTRDYVYCRSSDNKSVAYSYVEYSNTTDIETLWVMGSPYIITYRNFTNNQAINISCYIRDILGNLYTPVNRSYIVDIIPPGIDAVSSITGYTTTEFSWVTNENTTTSVYYGFNNTFFPFFRDASLFGTNHTMTIDNLTKNTDYYYYVESCDIARLCSKSFIKIFHTRDCRYLFSCTQWTDCLPGDVKTRDCSCVCGTACIGNGTESMYCHYSPPAIIVANITYDDLPYFYEENNEYIVSQKFYNTQTIILDLSDKFSMSKVKIKLNNVIPETRVIIKDQKLYSKNVVSIPNAINYYEILTSMVFGYFKQIELTFEVDKKYENQSVTLAAYRNSEWVDIETSKSNSSNSSFFTYYVSTADKLDNNYAIYIKKKTEPVQITTENEINNTKRIVVDEKKQEKTLKNYENPINIALIVFTIIVGIILIKIIDIYFSFKRHQLNATKKDTFLVINKENTLARFFKRLFR